MLQNREYHLCYMTVKMLSLVQRRIRMQEEKKEFMVVEDRSKLDRSVGLKIQKYREEKKILHSLLKFFIKTHTV